MLVPYNYKGVRGRGTWHTALRYTGVGYLSYDGGEPVSHLLHTSYPCYNLYPYLSAVFDFVNVTNTVLRSYSCNITLHLQSHAACKMAWHADAPHDVWATADTTTIDATPTGDSD